MTSMGVEILPKPVPIKKKVENILNNSTYFGMAEMQTMTKKEEETNGRSGKLLAEYK